MSGLGINDSWFIEDKETELIFEEASDRLPSAAWFVSEEGVHPRHTIDSVARKSVAFSHELRDQAIYRSGEYNKASIDLIAKLRTYFNKSQIAMKFYDEPISSWKDVLFPPICDSLDDWVESEIVQQTGRSMMSAKVQMSHAWLEKEQNQLLYKDKIVILDGDVFVGSFDSYNDIIESGIDIKGKVIARV